MQTDTRTPAYREPWQHGAYAYPQADTMAALWRGVRRKRSPLTVHVSHDGIGAEPCAHCGIALAEPYPVNQGDPPERWQRDTGGYAYVDIDPRARVAAARHYYCAWASTLAAVIRLGRHMSG